MSTLTPPAHFLLVEDDPSHAELVRLCLAASPPEVTVDHVSDGAAALAYLRRQGEYVDAPRPDLVLLDLKLPKLDGHEVLEQVKSDDALATIPIVVLTTSASESDRARAYRQHVNSLPVEAGRLRPAPANDQRPEAVLGRVESAPL